MRKKAIFILIIFYSISIVFHICVVAGFVPDSIVWGGNAKNKNEIYTLETVSLLLNTIFLVFALILNNTIKINLNYLIKKTMLWLMSALFIINTIGNLLAKNNLETIIFTPVTFLLSAACLFLAVNKES
ncbi:MAG TPA: hypothetical protein PK323_08190 [Bacteroidia bacterium]|nr:hypothetical protein [Bacteroidia bacterium]